MAVLPEGVTQEFFDFLVTVDLPTQRRPDHMITVAQAFLVRSLVAARWAHVYCLTFAFAKVNDIASPIDLIGVDFNECNTSTSHVLPRASRSIV